MALMNVAMDLVNKGRRVLVVDFDLEAPGLGTFGLVRDKAPDLGIVDFVTSYIATGTTPDVRPYVSSVHASANNGCLFVMPAGRHDDSYGERLASIDWGELYAKQAGFLALEDLKAQWKNAFAPDYVLIDSRTGHTDVAGICTRQLPDAVVVLFFPNDQNLAGLRKVVRDIRAEEEGSDKSIHLHFVPSNVPDLDDEDLILSDRLAQFRADLGYEEPAGTIHHNNSLALLNQVLYVVDRPRSSLAQEYQNLTRAIQQANTGDPEGAIHVLDEWYDDYSVLSSSPRHSEDELKQILERHPRNEGVLLRLYRIYMRQAQYEQALRLIDQVVTQSPSPRGEWLFRRAATRFNVEGATAKVTDDIRAGLNTTDNDTLQLKFAVNLLQRSQQWTHLYGELVTSPAIRALEDEKQQYIFQELGHIKEAQPHIVATLREKAAAATDREARNELNGLLGLCLIALGHFSEAVSTYNDIGANPAELTISDAFNAAMAIWGAAGEPSNPHLLRVLELADDHEQKDSVNGRQCMSLVMHFLNNRERALQYLNAARRALDREPVPIFSAWRYCNVGIEDLLKDLADQEKMLAGGVIKPLFLTARSMELLPFSAQRNN